MYNPEPTARNNGMETYYTPNCRPAPLEPGSNHQQLKSTNVIPSSNNSSIDTSMHHSPSKCLNLPESTIGQFPSSQDTVRQIMATSSPLGAFNTEYVSQTVHPQISKQPSVSSSSLLSSLPGGAEILPLPARQAVPKKVTRRCPVEGKQKTIKRHCR